MGNDKIVSFDDEPLILVNSDDDEVGHQLKAECHDGDGILHRAFSVFVFNDDNELLLQQRSPGKRLWPGFWANTCCSHPRRGEQTPDAARRRLSEELGMVADLTYLFKFEYHAPFQDLGSEFELCWVFVGRSNDLPDVNPTEISETRFMSPEALDQAMVSEPGQFTPWLKLEWKRLRSDFWQTISELS